MDAIDKLNKLRLSLAGRVLTELANLGVEVSRGDSRVKPEEIAICRVNSDSIYDIYTKCPEETLNVKINAGIMARTKKVQVHPDEEGVLIKQDKMGKMWYKVHYRSEIREKLSKIMQQAETDIRNAYYAATHKEE
jgi:hypothetical protein